MRSVTLKYLFLKASCALVETFAHGIALAAADSVVIPFQAQYLPAKGLEQLLQTINKVRRQINPKLKIDGILLTMDIPHSVRAAEISAEGKSIFAHDPKGKVAEAYQELTKEVLKIEKQHQKHRLASIFQNQPMLQPGCRPLLCGIPAFMFY